MFANLPAHRLPFVNGPDPGSKNRLRLWLRSERAFGLTMVQVPQVDSGPDAAPKPVEAPRIARFAMAPPKPAMPTVPRASKPTARPAEEAPVAKVSPKNVPILVPPPPALAFDAPPLPRRQKIARLKEMDATEVKGCTRCRLCETRTHTVFGEGDADAKIFFIGEGPGETEDLSGRPFVGRAGDLLEKMIGGMGLKREKVFIANIVKCRPPDNRMPAPDEMAACTPYLERQIEIVRPRVIVTLGLAATSYMLKTKLAMNRLRGKWQSWRGIKLMPTYHPAYVLRSYTEEVRGAVWSDLQMVLVELGMEIPKKGS